jgi:hypothetical protein
MKLLIRFQLNVEGTYAVIEYDDNNINNPINKAQAFLDKLKKEGVKAFNAEAEK